MNLKFLLAIPALLCAWPSSASAEMQIGITDVKTLRSTCNSNAPERFFCEAYVKAAYESVFIRASLLYLSDNTNFRDPTECIPNYVDRTLILRIVERRLASADNGALAYVEVFEAIRDAFPDCFGRVKF